MKNSYYKAAPWYTKPVHHFTECPKCKTTFPEYLKYKESRGCPFCHHKTNSKGHIKTTDAFQGDYLSKIKLLTPIQKKVIAYHISGVTYKEIAFRISGKGKGKYSCEQVSYLIRSAKQKILQVETKSEGK